MVPNTFSYISYPTYPPQAWLFTQAPSREITTCRRDGECRLRSESEREVAKVALLSEN